MVNVLGEIDNDAQQSTVTHTTPRGKHKTHRGSKLKPKGEQCEKRGVLSKTVNLANMGHNDSAIVNDTSKNIHARTNVSGKHKTLGEYKIKPKGEQCEKREPLSVIDNDDKK